MQKPDTVTEKGAASFSSTGDARLNFFFKAVRGSGVEAIERLVQASWDENALDTLKLIFQCRDCRGGKGEKAIFHAAIRWLAAQHPAVLHKNIEHIPFFGTWKDLLVLIGTQLEEHALDLMTHQLRRDMEVVNGAAAASSSAVAGAPVPRPSISLCVKWAPTERHQVDRLNGAAKKIAKKLYPGAKGAMKTYRRDCLVPLRAYLRVTETLMCSNRWNEISYEGVPSRCMNLQRKAFAKHDASRFNAFLQLAKEGKVTIKGKQMFPHELVKYYFTNAVVDDVLELQWKVLIEEARKSAMLKSSIVLSDVSGSMAGTPMEVSVALGLLISEITAPPFTNAVITFHEVPTFFQVAGETLCERVRHLKSAPWGGNTNFLAVFDLILGRAREYMLPQEAMPRRVFVLSDMQFDAADHGHQWKSSHQIVKEKYAAAGYALPEIVFWNLRATTMDFPVSADESGVSMLSGFSPSVLKALVEQGELKTPEPINPMVTLRNAIDDERYSCLQL